MVNKTDYDVDAFLAHYGKRGMHWGRSSRGDHHVPGDKAISSLKGVAGAKAAKSTNSEDHNAAQALKGRKLSSMSNVEIKTINTRRQLEMSYASLNKNPPSKGHAMVKKILATAATAEAVYKLSQSPMVKAGMAAVGTSSYSPKHAKGIKTVVSNKGLMSKAFKITSNTAKYVPKHAKP